jgi:hypothetical protein
MYAFQKSSGDFRVEQCRKFMSDSGSFWCLSGFWYVSCEGEYTLRTGSAQIEKRGTILWVMYLPEDNLTLVVVLEGEVEVRPVKDYPSTLGLATTLTAEEFYFTMPDAEMHDIAGLAPRTVYSYAELEPLVDELGIEDWIGAAVEQAQQDGFSVSIDTLYEDAVEEEARGDNLPGYSIFSVGGVFEESEFQEAVLLAVDWSETTFAGDVIVAWIGNEKVDVLADLDYDPDAARAFLEEQGYESIPSLKVFYEEDEELAEVARMVAEFLLKNRFAENVEVEEESPDYLGAEPAIFLKRIR